MANPMDPQSAIEMTKQLEVTPRYVEDVITSEAVNRFDIRMKVQLMAILGICCRNAEARRLGLWIDLESDPKMQEVLKRKRALL